MTLGADKLEDLIDKFEKRVLEYLELYTPMHEETKYGNIFDIKHIIIEWIVIAEDTIKGLTKSIKDSNE